MSNIPTIMTADILPTMQYCRDKDRTAFYHGAMGAAKSSVIRQSAVAMADDMELTFRDVTFADAPVEDPKATFGWIDARACTMDQSDTKGFGSLDTVDGMTRFLPPSWLPRADRDGDQGILFLDDFSQAFVATKTTFSSLILDGFLGDYVLPAGWQIVLSGNRQQDASATTRLPAFLANRCGHFEVVPDLPAWAQYNVNHEGGDRRCVAFIRMTPELLHNYKKNELAFGTLRSWSSASEAVAQIEDPVMRQIMVASFVGTGPAAELEGFLKIVASGEEIPTWRQIVTTPMEAPVPAEFSEHVVAISYAIIGIISQNISRDRTEGCDQMENVVKYIDRLAGSEGRNDYATCCMHDLANLMADDDIDDEPGYLLQTRAASGWKSRNPNAIIGA